MIKYVPFLKLKSNEIMAIKELEDSIAEDLTPFFDFARRKNSTAASFKKTATRLEKSIKKNASKLEAFYLDNYDVDVDFDVNGLNNYAYLLSLFKDLAVIPVVSIDRSEKHNKSVSSAKKEGIISSDIVACRITPEDFLDFDLVYNDIQHDLKDIFHEFNDIDLILDCRVCLENNAEELALNISSFIKKFCSKYNVRRIIVTGSSIPASISSIAGVNSRKEINRVELDIFDKVTTQIGDEYTLTLGDYGAVSPNYSDIDIPGGAMRNITAPKIIYPHDRQAHVIRGSALATHPLGNRQYKDLIALLVSEPFFRGEAYSFGESYLGEKSRGKGSGVTPSTMVKPLCNAHISYMCKDYI